MIFCLTGCSEPPVQVDFKAIPITESKNYHLICPPEYCNIDPNEISPIYSVDIQSVDYHWQEVMEKEPRIINIAGDEKKHQYTYVQRSKYLRLPDTINVQIIPMDNNHTTLAIYSKSKYGYSDFGSNKARIDDLLVKLHESLREHRNSE